MSRPSSTRDLLPAEQAFAAAMTRLGFGRFEYLRIERGELVLDPWPDAIRNVKFCAEPATPAERASRTDYELKRQVAEFFEYTRGVDSGEIRTLEVRHGLPFSMEIALAAKPARGGRP